MVGSNPPCSRYLGTWRSLQWLLFSFFNGDGDDGSGDDHDGGGNDDDVGGDGDGGGGVGDDDVDDHGGGDVAMVVKGVVMLHTYDNLRRYLRRYEVGRRYLLFFLQFPFHLKFER